MIASLPPEETERRIGELTGLLMDAVDGGASVGFMPPLERPEAEEYWRGVIEAQRCGRRVVLAAIENGAVGGSVQLDLETRANGNHRAEVMKLFVHRRARPRGLARALMAEADAVARRMGRTLLVMDTRKGGEAEKMCEALGYSRAGEVPAYARSGDGELHTTVFYYRALS